MGLRINTNVASIAAQRQISSSNKKFEGALKSLASGNRFDDPTSSAAEYAISERLRAQVQGVKAAKFNAENAQEFLEVGEGGLAEQNNILIRLRELAVQAASDTFSDTERELIDTEYQELSQELDRIAETTQFGSQKLLTGDGKDFEFQVGAHGGSENIIKFQADADTRASTLGIDGTTVSDKSDARDALESIDEAIMLVAAARSKFGSVQARLESTVSNAGMQIENLSSARSRIGDTDVAEAASNMYKSQALQQYQLAVLAQANSYPGQVLKLIA